MDCNCGVYNEAFIENLRSEVLDKIAYITNRDIANQKYNLGLKEELNEYNLLPDYIVILDKILKCSTCYRGFKIEDIISQIKNQLT